MRGWLTNEYLKHMKYFCTRIFMCVCLFVYASDFSDSTKTLINQKTKIDHAEPLYIDLIRDLGARKGEREWNVGLGMTDKFVTINTSHW
ncbi:hypothetical protein SanaruYs_30990 [Chryseotalea sanaruensis]|uniref:Uncharacterized protein n=1 Tax=Chryseotalea sanaruensis TaxID=2482724 RepID=A0A401UDB3_9BACT|nr:hypothetical protein SanaruYs_30990 [Chryseotalea sanaruensis]